MLSALNINKRNKEKSPKETVLPESVIEAALEGTNYDGSKINNLKNEGVGKGWEETLSNGRTVSVCRVSVEPSEVHINNTSVNKRANLVGIQKLAALIKESNGNTQVAGIQKAKEGALHGKKYEIVWGKRRTMGSIMAGFMLKADLYLDPISDAEASLLAAMENAGRRDPNYFEKAEIYKSLLAEGWSKVALADAEGISRQQLDKLLWAESFPSELRDKINNVDKVIRTKCIELGRLVMTLKQNDIDRWNVVYAELIKQDYLDVNELLTRLRKDNGEVTESVDADQKRKMNVGMNSGGDAVFTLEGLKSKTNISIELKKTYKESELEKLQKVLEDFIKEL